MANVTIRFDAETNRVWLDGKELNLQESLKLRNHSPTGFNFGYGGSGPAQSALAILLQFTDEETALKYYQKFKWQIVAKLPQVTFETKLDVLQWLEVQYEWDFFVEHHGIGDPRNPELIAALQKCLDWFDDHYDGAPDARCDDMVEPMDQARRALNQIRQLGKLSHNEN